MAFRRPRVNVKPNVQATRPVTSTIPSLNTSTDSVSIQSQEEQSTQQADPVVTSSVETAPISNVDDTPASTPPPDIKESTPTSLPTPSSPPPPAPSPSPAPPSTATTRPLFRRKIAPNIGVKTAIHHRRPSASCSGTESETESSRQKHSTTSSITFGRINPPVIKPIASNENQVNVTPDLPLNGDVSIPTKAELTTTDVAEVHTPLADTCLSQISTAPSRMTTRISREYLTQHITYRAQRLASKVEPDMTIRKRRAATLEKLDEAGVHKGEPVDTSKFKIADFVHYNPVDNPMEVKLKTTAVIAANTDPSNDPVRKHSISSFDEQNSNSAPQLKIDANGALVVDEESLYFRKVTDAPRNTIIVEGQFNDDNLTHQSYRKIGRRKRWNNRDTLRFYQALRMCGTDFTLIARVFPNRDRDDIKRKFKTEDKANRTLVDSALTQRIPFDLTCFYSPSEDSSEDENGSDVDNPTPKRPRKRRMSKRKPKQTSSSDPLEINRRREKRLQAKKNSMRIKKSAEFVNDDDDDEESLMDIEDTVEVTTSEMQSKTEQVIPSSQNDENTVDNSITNMAELENLLGRIDGSHLLFVHNTDETTGLDRIDVHVVMPNGDEQTI